MRRLRRRGEDGSALVETAIVLPVILMLAVGLAEIGFLGIDKLTMSNAAREGARVGAAAAKSSTADLTILHAVEQASCALRYGDLTKVEIYKAAADGSPLDTTNLLNEYTPGGPLNCSTSGGTALTCANGCPWPPSARNNLVTNTDDIGVRVTYTHRSATGLFPLPGLSTLTDRVIMRLEPDNGLGN